MRNTWFIVESEPQKVLLVEIHPYQSDGTLKHFRVDGEGYMWLPYTNPPAEMGASGELMKLGRLLAVTQGPPEAQFVIDLVQAKEIIIVPMS